MIAAKSAWIVKTPRGRAIEETRRDSQAESISAMEAYAGNTWSNLHRRGYRTCLQQIQSADRAMGGE